MTPTCSDCGQQLEAGSPGGEAEHGTVRGILEAPASWACPDGHTAVTADLAAAAAELRDVLDIAERTRIRSTLRCAECGTPYRLPGRRALRSVTLVTTGLPATRVTFDLPMLRCTEDAIESLPPECLDDLDAVTAQLLGAR